MPAAADYSAIAKAILDQLSSQVGLATTLATAISGGLVALVIQVAIHNRSGGTTPLVLNAQWLVLAALYLRPFHYSVVILRGVRSLMSLRSSCSCRPTVGTLAQQCLTRHRDFGM